MPIWLRRLTYNHLVDFRNKEAEAKTAANTPEGHTQIDFNKLDEAKRLMDKNVAYTTKASKK
jgi:hypothetical protein